jgi:predicted transcriptional regulator
MPHLTLTDETVDIVVTPRKKICYTCIANAIQEVRPMKSASIPSLRVEPELRKAAESVLRDGESLSSFVEQSLRAHVTRRQLQNEFVARGLASRDEARRTGEYVDADVVHAELHDMLVKAETAKGKR